MASSPRTLAARFGQVHAHATFIQAALVAAHGAAAPAGGFRAVDVRFFFLLFTNWLEHDVLHPGQDLDLTQVRRALGLLARQAWVRPCDGPGGGARGTRYALTSAGLVGLVEALCDTAVRRPFEEMLFLVCFAASYRGPIVARVRGEAATLTPAARRRAGELLDPQRLLRAARRAQGELLADLDERVRSGQELADESARATADGADPVETARRLERRGGYQLHRVRPLAEVLGSLPADLQRFELGDGLRLRVSLLFAPLAAQTRAQLAALDAVERALAAEVRTRSP